MRIQSANVNYLSSSYFFFPRAFHPKYRIFRRINRTNPYYINDGLNGRKDVKVSLGEKVESYKMKRVPCFSPQIVESSTLLLTRSVKFTLSFSPFFSLTLSLSFATCAILVRFLLLSSCRRAGAAPLGMPPSLQSLLIRKTTSHKSSDYYDGASRKRIRSRDY